MSGSGTGGKATGSAGGLPVGSKLGKYEIAERLGAGGEAIVYKGRDPLLDRYVAIKQVAPQLAEDEKFLDRFRDVVRRLSRLGCEEIVTIYELIEDENGTFVVMEFVEGHSIETTLATQPGPVEPKAVLQILWRIAAGLAQIHKAGIIHRDIKPANIIVGEGLRVKITDFGVAARAGVPASMRLGTTKYMAPELFAGTQVDGRADIYSLGMIAYEMLLGREKFNQVFHEVLRDPHSEALRWMKWHSSAEEVAPALHKIEPSVPKPLSLIVAKMLAKDPEQRFSNVEGLGREIRASFSPRAQVPLRRGPRKRRVSAKAAAEGQAALLEEQAEELVVAPGQAAEPLTARVPKQPMPLLKKLVLTGAAVAVVITFLAVWQGLQYGKRQELRRQAELTLGVAKDLYDKASQAETFAEKKAFYGQALEKYRAVIRDYGQQELARRAMVKGYICRAHLALIERNWQETDQYVVRADEVLKEVERSGGEVKDWVRDVQRELSDFRDYWDGQRVYEEGLEEARKAMEAGKLRTADKILLEKAGPAAATREQFAKVEGFRKEISEKEKQEAYWQLVQRGEEQAAEGDVAGATACYDQAIKVLEDGRKTLDLKIYTDLKRTAETKKNALLARTRYQAALKAARRQDKKDPLEAAKAYREAVAVFESFRGKLPPDEQKQLLAIADPAVLADTARDLEHDYWLEQGKGHLAAGRIRDAQRDLEKARQIKDSSAVRAELAKIQESKDCAALVFAGDRLFRDKNYAAALEKYQQALKFESASRAELSGKVTDCQYQLELTAAQGHMAKSEWDQAKAALLRAKRIKPANSPQVDAMLDQLGRDRDFIRLMAEAQKAREMGKYGDAIARLTEAKKIRPESTELDRLMRTVRYEHYLAVGRVAMEQKEYAGALGYFKLARGFMNTEEIEKLIQQAENGLKVEGGG